MFGLVVDVRFFRDQVAGTLQFFHNDRRRFLEVVHLGLDFLACLCEIVEIRF